MSITEELSKTEYQIGTNQERFELLKSKTASTVGKIAYGNTLHLVSMLARGLRARIDACTNPALKNAWSEALQPAYLASPAYSINVALPEIRTMLDGGLAAGLITADDHAFIIQLATYERQLFPDATLKDVVARFNPELIDGQWHEIESTDKQWLQVQLNTRTPETTHIVVQWQAVDGEWYHAQAIHGLLAPMQYRAQLPYHGVPRKLRWKCDYSLDGQVTVS
jgi:hypothetical protein